MNYLKNILWKCIFFKSNKVLKELKEFEELLEEGEKADTYTRAWVARHILCRPYFKEQNKLLRTVLDAAKCTEFEERIIELEKEFEELKNK